MGMPVKLSDELVTAARAEAEASQRSIAAQVEHWARLGQAVEAVLPHPDVVALKRAPDLSAAFPDRSKREAVLAILDRLGASPERDAALRRVRGGEGPVYGSDADYPGLVVRIDPDGTRTPGRFEKRRFVPAA